MREISIRDIQPGMVLAKPIRREKDGALLLQDNTELKPSYIEKIRTLNNNSAIWIQDAEESEHVDPLTPIREETRIKASTLLKATFNQFKSAERVDPVKIQFLIKEIVDQILGDPLAVYNLSQLRAYDNYTFLHSVDVCVISLLIGSVMGLSRNELEILGVGAILHDIGKVYTDFRILNKPTKLEIEEYEKVKEHTRDGYECLRTKFNISFLVPHMAMQHHEREDGSGYPRGLTGKRIHRFAKIIAVADVFNAMTSERLYQKAVRSQIAIQDIYLNTPLKYDRVIVDNFIKVVTPYSVGSVLRLSNHQNVSVTYISKFKCNVKVIAGVNEGEVYNLYQHPELNVVEQLQ